MKLTVKFFWFCLTLLALSTWQLPAWAGQLIFWDFDEQRRELEFRTDANVQPQAQLIPDPSRLVIDLPGTTLSRSLFNRTYNGKIRTIRLGQFTPNTARLVVELEPGYTLDPDQIRFEGRSPRDWAVTLPEPELITDRQSSQSTPSSTTLETVATEAEDGFLDDRILVTQGGFYINLDSIIEEEIDVDQEGDRLEITLEDVILPADLANESISVDRYKVETINFAQTSRDQVTITLELEENSPAWNAVSSPYGSGGLVLIPEGGTTGLEPRDVSPSPVPDRILQTNTEPTVVESIELANNGSQLILRGSERLEIDGGWNRNEGLYQIRVNNATLAQPVRGPELDSRSPVSRISMRQETENTVLVQIEPALGVQIGNLSQPSDRIIALELNRLRDLSTPNNPDNSASNPIFVPPVTNDIPPITNIPPRSNIVVMIDPGHGGRDPGAVGIGGLQEKQVIMPISLEVAQILQQNGIGVRMTRDSDYFVSLQGRAQLANQSGADLFVSIHANAISLSRPDVNGLEVYYYQSGRQLAQSVHSSILSQIRMRDRGVKTARFYVLRNTAMPSILVEVGFVTGREDAPNLSSPAFRSQMAQAIADGILEYVRTNNL